MCTRVLHAMYTLIPRACGPQDSGVHIRQNTRAHVTTTEFKITVSHLPISDHNWTFRIHRKVFSPFSVKYFVNLYFESIKGKLDAAGTMLSSWKYIPM